MIPCPNCHHQEIAGSLYCSQCGAQLVFAREEGAPGSTLNTPPPLQNPGKNSITPPPFPASQPDSLISLHIVDSGEVLPLPRREEITIGRVAEGQPIIPDIDLTAFQAYESGVSRMHASIKIVDQNITVTDLGSANGTRVNGKKIGAHTPFPLHHGDILTLGKFKIQVLIRSEAWQSPS
jgi:pSer/pThr/pTyr-binding forkhead associated (FHA) protein